jgi:hypothetical protein
VLKRFAFPLALALAVSACASAPPPSPADPKTEATVAAKWVTVDGWVVALNVVLAPRTDQRRLPELARAYRDRHPGARVIVRFFASNAGQERFVIGHVPTDGEPLSPEAGPTGALATFDFPAAAPSATGGAQ